MNNFVYVIGDRTSGEAVVIDGAWDPDGISELVQNDGLNLVSHVATHYHYDHIGGNAHGMTIPGIREWAERGLPIHVPVQELDLAISQTGADESKLHTVEDGQRMALSGNDDGPSFGLEFIHTPGHSPGSMCVMVTHTMGGERGGEEESLSNETVPEGDLEGDGEESLLLLVTADTIFPGSCGRLDLPGSDPAIMYDSLRRLAQLPDELPIYPGHGYSGEKSTIGREKTSGLLRDMTRAQWSRMMER
jgi:glyoxylase-like metal-dependent hydrolase (beta-lactamase superfamily II)